MKTEEQVVAEAAAGDTAPGYEPLAFTIDSMPINSMAPAKVRAYASVSINTNSNEGRAVLANVVGKALQETGFTNVKLMDGNYNDPPKPFVAKKPETVLDALMARNPSFLNTEVNINAGHQPWMPNILPDSEFPCNGSPAVAYKVGQGVRGDIVQVDANGTEEVVGFVNAQHDLGEVVDLLNAGLKKKGKK